MSYRRVQLSVKGAYSVGGLMHRGMSMHNAVLETEHLWLFLVMWALRIGNHK